MSRTLIYKFSLQFGIKGIIYFINMYLILDINDYTRLIKKFFWRYINF